MHALHAAFFMPLLLFQNGVLGRKISKFIVGITSKNQRFSAVIPGGGTDIVCNARFSSGIFYAFVAFPKRSFGAQKGIKNAP
jgi:hypothetical protein